LTTANTPLGRTEFVAIWLLEVGIVQFYDAEGNMLATVNILEDVEPVKMAA
jgi:hypothetical protein